MCVRTEIAHRREGKISSITILDLTASLHSNNNTLSSLVKSYLAKLDTSYTVILPPYG